MAIIQGRFARYTQAITVATSDVGTPGLTLEGYRDVNFNMLFFRHNQDDSMFVVTEMPTSKRLGATGVIAGVHMHCIPMVDPAASPQNIYLEIQYTYQIIGAEVPVSGSWTTLNVTIPIVTGDAFKIKTQALLTDLVSPANETYDSFLLMRVTRLGNNVLDTYDTNKVGGTVSANLALLSFDASILTDRIGSINASGD